jgi:Ser/Thr protein kinase RdoA (MazF antagonist)
MNRNSNVAVRLMPDGADGPDIARLLAVNYGITVAGTTLLGGELDRNIGVQAVDGTRYLLKVTTSDSAESLDWQPAMLEHIAATSPELPVPRIVPGLNGMRLIRVPVGDGDVIIRLLTWCEGVMIGDIDQPGEDLLFRLGESSAQLTRSLIGFPSESMMHTHHWDVRSSRESVDACLPFVADASDRARVESIMEMFDAVLPELANLPMGVVHQDLNDFNVLAAQDDEGNWGISGILDFGDALYTLCIADTAVAGAYAMLRQPDPIGALSAVVRGVDSVIQLTEAELAVVFPLAAARLCVNATTWTRRTQGADQPYGRERMRFTWPTIRKISELKASEVLLRLDSACHATVARGSQTRQ